MSTFDGKYNKDLFFGNLMRLSADHFRNNEQLISYIGESEDLEQKEKTYKLILHGGTQNLFNLSVGNFLENNQNFDDKGFFKYSDFVESVESQLSVTPNAIALVFQVDEKTSKELSRDIVTSVKNLVESSKNQIDNILRLKENSHLIR